MPSLTLKILEIVALQIAMALEPITLRVNIIVIANSFTFDTLKLISLYTFKYHVFAPMGRFQLELIYLYFPPSFHLTVVSDLYALRC